MGIIIALIIITPQVGKKRIIELSGTFNPKAIRITTIIATRVRLEYGGRPDEFDSVLEFVLKNKKGGVGIIVITLDFEDIQQHFVLFLMAQFW